jgi:hypothetical protein
MKTGNVLIGGIGAVKKKQDQYVFNVYEMGDVSEDSGQAEYKKVKVLNKPINEDILLISANCAIHGLSWSVAYFLKYFLYLWYFSKSLYVLR